MNWQNNVTFPFPAHNLIKPIDDKIKEVRNQIDAIVKRCDELNNPEPVGDGSNLIRKFTEQASAIGTSLASQNMARQVTALRELLEDLLTFGGQCRSHNLCVQLSIQDIQYFKVG